MGGRGEGVLEEDLAGESKGRVKGGRSQFVLLHWDKDDRHASRRPCKRDDGNTYLEDDCWKETSEEEKMVRIWFDAASSTEEGNGTRHLCSRFGRIYRLRKERGGLEAERERSEERVSGETSQDQGRSFRRRGEGFVETREQPHFLFPFLLLL